MAVPRLTEEEEREVVVATIDAWIARWLEQGEGILAAADRQDVTDGTASHRWYLRFTGTEREAVTVWLTFHQRTLHHEAQFMPAPEENQQQLYEYLLKRNRGLYAMAFTIGLEDAVYLEGRVAGSEVDEAELDRILGTSLQVCDDLFPAAMGIGYRSRYRRSRKA